MPLFSNENTTLLYIHIPKCAGSSVNQILADSSKNVGLYYTNENHDFPCNPQHFQASLLQNICSTNEVQNSVAIVRHPILRIVSEHLYRNNLRRNSSKPEYSFSRDIQHYFRNYKYNNYIYDNHIRPQLEFIFPETKVFKIETQYAEAIRFCTKKLNPDLLDTTSEGVKKNQSPSKNLTLTGKDLLMAQEFYGYDYELLNYPKIEIGKNETVLYSELKSHILNNICETGSTYKSELVKEYYFRKSRDRSSRVGRILDRGFHIVSRNTVFAIDKLFKP